MKYAVIDIGSNSVKMSIATIENQTYKIDQLFKKHLRLLDQGRTYIREEEIEILVDALLFFENEIQKHGCVYRMMATSALRRAENQTEVIEKIYDRLKMKIEVIAGAEEARLVSLAHQHLFDMRNGHHLIFDIGGGSLECIEIENGKEVFQTSLQMGALLVRSMFPSASDYSSDAIYKVMLEIKTRLEDRKVTKKKKKTKLYISGGNPSAVSFMNLKHHQIYYRQLHSEDVYLKELKNLLHASHMLTPKEIMAKYDLKPYRADLAIATIVLIRSILEYVGLDYYTMSKTGIREGEVIRKMLEGPATST